MSLKIRLSRGGTKKRPFYRIVVADARMPRDGRFVEKIGTFDPLKAKDDASRVVLDQEKAKAGSPRARSRPTACCACSTASASPSAKRATIRRRRSRRRRPRSAPPQRRPQPKRPRRRPRPERLTQPARARPAHPDGRVRRAAGRARRDSGQVADRRAESHRRLRAADRQGRRARVRVRIPAPAQGRHAGRAGRRRFDPRGGRGAEGRGDLRPP